MPSRTTSPIQAPELVVVTGANGFIAQHCVAALLRQGFKVLGTVRTAAKATSVRDVHSQNPNLDVLVVEDITSSDAYLSALRDLSPSAIIHLAAPFTYATNDFERDLMIPSVKGTTALFEAASQIKSVRRVALTSSFACVFDSTAGLCPEKTYTAKDFSPLTYEDGVNAPNPPAAYRASKMASERAGLDFMRERMPQFDLVTLCPGMVFGTFLPGAEPSSIQQLNTSNHIVYGVVSAGSDSDVPPTRAPVWVDVRDTADAHVRSLTTPEAGGGRFLLAGGVYCNQEIADVSRKVLGDANPKLLSRIPVGETGKREAHTHFKVDASETEDVLGIRWRGLGECLQDLVPQLYEIEQSGA